MTAQKATVVATLTAFIAGSLCGVLAMSLLRSAPIEPAVVLQSAIRSTTFAITIPVEKRSYRNSIVEFLTGIDWPARLKSKSPEYSEVAAKWEREPLEHGWQCDYGAYIINVTIMPPRYVAADPKSGLALHCADLLNRDVVHVCKAIVEEKVQNWQPDQGSSPRTTP